MQKTQVIKINCTSYNYCPKCGELKEVRAQLCMKCRFKYNPPVKGKGFFYTRGYKFVLVPGHPYGTSKGFIPEHRYIMEHYLNGILESHLHIHHINEIRNDNRLENLELLTHGEHRGRHKKAKVGKGHCRYDICPRCGKLKTASSQLCQKCWLSSGDANRKKVNQ